VGVPDRVNHVSGRPGLHDEGGPLVDSQIPRLARLVVADLARHEYLAPDSRSQGVQAAAGNGVRSIHCFLPSFLRIGGDAGFWMRSVPAFGWAGLAGIAQLV
jgi:hypothetical protein